MESSLILDHIVQQHAANAAFLWHLRDLATGRPQYRLRDLRRLDQRVEANLDGLRVAGDAGWEICLAALDEGDAGELFAAASIAVGRRDLAGIARVLDASDGAPGRAREIVSALGWVDFERVQSILPGLLSPRCPPALHWLGIAACAVNRVDPGQALDLAARSEDLRLRRRAVDAVGELGRTDLRGQVERALEAEDEELRFRAARTGTLLGSATAVEALSGLARAGGHHAERAVWMAVRRAGSSESGALIRALASSPASARTAAVGAGALGDPAHIPWLLDAMATPTIARVAAAGYATITGVDLADAGLEAQPPASFESGPTEDAANDDVELDPDEDLPWPDVAALRRHWKRSEAALASGQRHFLGRPISTDHLRDVLRSGGQRQRAAAAVELALLTPGRPLFEVRAPGFRQAALIEG